MFRVQKNNEIIVELQLSNQELESNFYRTWLPD